MKQSRSLNEKYRSCVSGFLSLSATRDHRCRRDGLRTRPVLLLDRPEGRAIVEQRLVMVPMRGHMEDLAKDEGMVAARILLHHMTLDPRQRFAEERCACLADSQRNIVEGFALQILASEARGEMLLLLRKHIHCE